MIKSMTGYGRAVQSFGTREITVEIRSVNNRYLDCNVKLPRVFSFAEEPIKQLVKEHISRGKVDVMISVSGTEDSNIRVSLNRPVLEGYLHALRTAAEEYGLRDDISVMSLSRFPDVLTIEKEAEDEEAIQNALLQTAAAALMNYNQMPSMLRFYLMNSLE